MPASEKNADAPVAGDAVSRDATPSIPAELPVLPLTDILIFPGMIVPLLVNSERERRLVDDVVAGSRYLAAVVQQSAQPEQGAAEAPSDPAALYKYGCVSRVLRMLTFPDGSIRVLIQGVSRCRVAEFRTHKDYLVARCRMIADKTDESVELEALFRSAIDQFSNVITASPTLPEEMRLVLANMNDAGKLSDFIAANLNMPMERRKEFLKEDSPRARLHSLMPLLTHEIQVLQVGSQIQDKVQQKISKSQRELYLREQLRAIQKELGEEDPGQAALDELTQRIEAAAMPQEARETVDREVTRLRAIPPASPEHGIIRTYLDWLIELPWQGQTEDMLDIGRAREILDRDHYDLTKVKDRILEFLSVLKLKKDLSGPILCFVGPPGVGKTSLGQSIAGALGRQFIRMSVGGMHDEAEIRGHRRTYIGAMPGRILQSIRKAKSRNPVFMIDEVDKMGSDFRGDPSSALLEVLDPEQNFSFTDHYLEVPFDLSKVLFIATANQMEPIPPPLRDRMEVITLPGYTLEEKLQIAKRFLVPKQIAGHGLKRTHISIRKPALRGIVTDYTREAGVRNLEREIANVCRKVARAVAEGRRKKTTVVPSDLHTHLGPRRFETERAGLRGQIGVATGLAWTPVGGQILFIEATEMPGKGQLILTGSLGDVMKESAQAAHSHVRAHAKRWRLPEKFAETKDLHIHVPAGATPKDGPSAGLAILLAIFSLLAKRRLISRLAVTGEITLRGRVLPVGGIKEKVLAASRARIKQVLLPEGNRADIGEIPTEIRAQLDMHFVENAEQAIRIAIGDADWPGGS